MNILSRLLLWLGVIDVPIMQTGSSPSLAPHERWPEILHWKKGDQFYFVHWRDRAWKPVLESLTEDGYAYCREVDGLVKLPISKMVGLNESARTREVSEEMKQSNEYMELIKQFNIALDELKKRDKR